jgi:hypothetical protein
VVRSEVETGADPSAPPSGLPDDDVAELEPREPQGSLLDDLGALLTDGKTYLQAEVAYQKSRAGYAANRLKFVALYGAAAFALLHLALIGLTVGAVFALAPLIGPWLATALVVVVLALGAAFFALKLRGKLADIRGAFEDGGE